MSNTHDEDLVRRAIVVSARSRENGNHPFGAVLASPGGEILLEAENTVVTTGDVTGHAEINLVQMASTTLPLEVVAASTLYASTEPCAMCSGAIYWSGISRLVYAMAESDLLDATGANPENPTLHLGCRVVLGAGQRSIEVIGPTLAAEAMSIHESFWTRLPR